MMVRKSIKLADFANDKAEYRVEQLTNSTFYRIGQHLHRREVDQMIASGKWTVTIVKNTEMAD